jgi:hypothetical protein
MHRIVNIGHVLQLFLARATGIGPPPSGGSISGRRVARNCLSGSFLLGRLAGAEAVKFNHRCARLWFDEQVAEGPHQRVDAVPVPAYLPTARARPAGDRTLMIVWSLAPRSGELGSDRVAEPVRGDRGAAVGIDQARSLTGITKRIVEQIKGRHWPIPHLRHRHMRTLAPDAAESWREAELAPVMLESM